MTNLEAIAILEGSKKFIYQDGSIFSDKFNEAINTLKQAINDLELYKSLFNSPDTKPNNDNDIIECICFVREIHTKKVMLEVCDWCYGEWDIANNFELLGWTLARKELSNGNNL